MNLSVSKLEIINSINGVISINFVDHNASSLCDGTRASKQLNEYFLGTRTKFDIKLNLIGTPFQLKVWKALRSIPYGEIVTYQDIANKIKQPKAVRAVANAIGANPVAIIIPCHRIVRSDGSLGGYRWGSNLKKHLQQLETSG